MTANYQQLTVKKWPQEAINPWMWETEYGIARVACTDKHWQRVDKMLTSGTVYLDTETTGITRNRGLRLVQIGKQRKGRLEAWLLDPASNMGQKAIWSLMEEDIVFICHNAPFDLLSLGLYFFGDDTPSGKPGFKAGCKHRNDIAQRIYDWMTDKALSEQVCDTMVADQISESIRRVRGLATIAALEGVHNDQEQEWEDNAVELGYTAENKYSAVSVNNEHWLRYAAHDIFQLAAVHSRLADSMTNPLVVSETKCAVLYEILKHRGMYIDFSRANALYSELAAKKLETVELLRCMGLNNANSPTQVRSALLKLGAKLTVKTKTGQLSTAKGVLEKIKKPKKAGQLVKHIQICRSLTKDMASAHSLATHSDGTRVYPQLWRIGAITGRSTCDTPNLQQLNKHEGDARVRGIIMADPGDVIGSVDFSGIEIVVCALLTRDKRLLKKLRAGADIHGELAAEVFGNEFTDKERYYAKRCVFAMLFGAGDNTMAATVNIDPEEAAAIRQAWQQMYPKATRVMAGWSYDADLTGIAELPNGWSPSVGTYTPKGSNRERVAGYRAMNYNIQGIAAFIFRQAAIQVAEAGLWKYVRMLVHDEFVTSLPKKKAPKLLARIRKAAIVHTDLITFNTKGELYDKHWGEYRDE